MDIGNIIFAVVFYIFLGYFLVQAIYSIILVLMGFVQVRRRRFEYVHENYDTFARSFFIVPVTIIVPAHNEEVWIKQSLLSLLNVKYPMFEVIIVNDGSTDTTMDVLDSILQLRRMNRVFTNRFDCGKINGIFASGKYDNVTVIDKESGYHKAGALDAGLIFAKYQYILVIDADTILEPDALFKVMPYIDKNPDENIGIGAYFGLVNGFKIEDGKILEKRHSYNPIIACQNLEYIRNFIGARLTWSRYNAIPCVSGGFGVWRRNMLLEMGGFSSAFSCEDIEITFRAHSYMNKEGKPYRIMTVPFCVGWTEGPANISSLIIQRKRWHRVVIEVVTYYREMFFNKKYKVFGLVTMPYMVLYEMCGVLFELSSLVFVVIGYFLGVLSIKIFLAYFLLMIILNSLTGLVAIISYVILERSFSIPYILYLIVLSILDMIIYRPFLLIAKVKGSIEFFKGYRAGEQYKRPKIT
ncbi:MAG: glycosyltransferase [Candidatus Omnitrophica bacterium]|nr:glycosyltransferase [Candidatus Omnitrophota bacterium]